MNWNDFKILVVKKFKESKLSNEYWDRLKYEISEIEKQGANGIWIDAFINNNRYKTNSNGLVLPFILGMTDIDPIRANVTYKLDDGGYVADVVDIEIGDDIYSVPGDCLVMTKRGKIRASSLQIGDEIT